MLIEPIGFTLKDGRRAVLRCGEAADAPGMIEYLRVSAAETEFLIRYPEECDDFTEEREEALFRAYNERDNGLMLVCEVDGRIAGSCDITWSNWMKTRHRAEIALALVSEFWGLGIGTRMLQTMIDVAKAQPYITQLELEYVEGNSRARALYEKMGFRIVGVKPDAIRFRDGRTVSMVEMVKRLDG